jgi:divalent metal cation (Fe/Co/Zn/Cd) transporter
MDVVDLATVDQATAAIGSVDGVKTVPDLRIRWIGHSLHAEAEVTVDPHLSVVEGHDLAHNVEQHLIAYVGRLTSATIHVSPAS